MITIEIKIDDKYKPTLGNVIAESTDLMNEQESYNFALATGVMCVRKIYATYNAFAIGDVEKAKDLKEAMRIVLDARDGGAENESN